MGGVILFGLFVLAIYMLISPALKARRESRRENDKRAAHEAVVRRLDDHRKKALGTDDEPRADE